jgi:hypothetical protein
MADVDRTAADLAAAGAAQPTLAGLELQPEYGSTSSAMRNAVVVTLGALERDGLLEPRHAALGQLALELADAVAAGRRGGRASAAAMAAAQLLAVLEALPAPMAADVESKFNAFVDSLVNSE